MFVFYERCATDQTMAVDVFAPLKEAPKRYPLTPLEDLIHSQPSTVTARVRSDLTTMCSIPSRLSDPPIGKEVSQGSMFGAVFGQILDRKSTPVAACLCRVRAKKICK